MLRHSHGNETLFCMQLMCKAVDKQRTETQNVWIIYNNVANELIKCYNFRNIGITIFFLRIL